MLLSISEIILNLAEITGAGADLKRIQWLKDNDSEPLRNVLQFGMDPAVKCNLPPGRTPYKPSEAHDSQFVLHQEARKLYIFCVGGADSITPLRRETLWVEFLQSLDPKDAQLMDYAKDKELTKYYKYLTMKLVDEAFPGLLYGYDRDNDTSNDKSEETTTEEVVVKEVKKGGRPKSKVKETN